MKAKATKAAPLKKPAWISPATSKRPAGSAPGKKPVIKVTIHKSELRTATCHNLASVWHNRARKIMIDAGVNDDQAKEEGRKVHKVVRKVWQALEKNKKDKTGKNDKLKKAKKTDKKDKKDKKAKKK